MQIRSDLINLTSFQVLAPPSSSQNRANTQAVRVAVNAVNESQLLGFDRELRFSTDPLSKVGVVEVVDRSTGQVVVQIPSQFILDLAEALQNSN